MIFSISGFMWKYLKDLTCLLFGVAAVAVTTVSGKIQSTVRLVDSGECVFQG